MAAGARSSAREGVARRRAFSNKYHHVVPFAAGGKATTSNISLRCRAQNAHEAEVNFGATPPLFVSENIS
jgi:hypothetical protein